MCLKNQILFLITFLICVAFGYSQDPPHSINTEQILRTASLDSLASNSFKHYSADEFSFAIDIAIAMSKVENNEVTKQRGTNLMATLAKSFAKQVNAKTINLDNEKVKGIIVRFESEKYFIEKPKISRFIKLMNYLCKGDYAYAHQRLLITRTYKAFLILIFIYLSIFLLSYSSKFKWKLKKKFRKFTLYSFAVLLLVFFLFKSTCHNNIKDYSFYGISV